MENLHPAQLAARDGPPPPLVPPADGSAYYPISERAARLAVLHLAGTTPLLVIGLIMYVARVWVRVRPAWRIRREDYVMTVGTAAAIVDIAFMVPQMYTSPTLLTEKEQLHARRYAFLAIPIWGVAMALIKSSIALTLIRIQANILWWKIFLWTIIAIMSIYGVGNVFFILLQCRPLEASWNPAILQEVEGSCLPIIGIHIMSNLGSVINIGSDVLLSLAPIMFLWRLRRPLREKILVGVLMALGLFASIASIFKTLTVTDYGKPGIDAWALNMSLATWTALEQLVAMIAASAPFLKPLLQPVFERMGFSLSSTMPADFMYGDNRYYRTSDQNGSISRPQTGFVEDDSHKAKTNAITTTTQGSDKPCSDSIAACEEGIPLEPRRVKQKIMPRESSSSLENQSDGNEWEMQRKWGPGQAV